MDVDYALSFEIRIPFLFLARLFWAFLFSRKKLVSFIVPFFPFPPRSLASPLGSFLTWRPLGDTYIANLQAKNNLKLQTNKKQRHYSADRHFRSVVSFLAANSCAFYRLVCLFLIVIYAHCFISRSFLTIFDLYGIIHGDQNSMF
jgi:hypothetical protein